jgi:bud site selection protein 20
MTISPRVRSFALGPPPCVFIVGFAGSGGGATQLCCCSGLVQDARGYSIPKFDFDEDLPGGGQFYCGETGKHFVSKCCAPAGSRHSADTFPLCQINARALADHKKTKAYKKRVKELKLTPYSQEEADRAGGMMKEVLPPAHGPKSGGAMELTQ